MEPSRFGEWVRKRKTKSETRSKAYEDVVDRISALKDDLLVRILSFLPTKVAVSTSILSKRWECLWMWLPKLKYNATTGRIGSFLDLSLPLHRAPVIRSFHLDISSSVFSPHNIQLWLLVALSRNLRKLRLRVTYLSSNKKPNILPSSLYTCKSLVILRPRGDICLDVPRLGCLPSLKTLELILDNYFDGESLRRLLSICHVLENLDVYLYRDSGDDFGLITVTVPSLQSFTVYMPSDTEGVFDGLLLVTPSLEYLKFEDCHDSSRPSFYSEAMPDLEEAYVDLRYDDITASQGHIGAITSIERLMSSITSVKRLTICLEFLYGDGLVFNQLEHLKLCVHTGDSSNLLARLLQDSPNLRVLDIFLIDHFDTHWEKPPTSVRESVLSSLQTFNWSRYFERRPQEMDLAIYILGEKWTLNDFNNLV